MKLQLDCYRIYFYMENSLQYQYDLSVIRQDYFIYLPSFIANYGCFNNKQKTF